LNAKGTHKGALCRVGAHPIILAFTGKYGIFEAGIFLCHGVGTEELPFLRDCGVLIITTSPGNKEKNGASTAPFFFVHIAMKSLRC
jgi:hypothetical protein